MSSVTIAVDAMGGDFGLSVTLPACLSVLATHPGLTIILVGDKKRITESHTRLKTSSRMHVVHADEAVGMDEPPAQALRRKKNSSLRIACDLVKANKADACVSAGNTGALMAIARYSLKTLEGIDRPAIISTLPTLTGKGVYLLDLGANVDCTARQLEQFAIMSTILVSCVQPEHKPRVGLLNVGEELIKGNEQVKQTHRLLEQNQWVNYQGYVEGDDIYKGVVDIVVCDGFVGNAIIKSSEGLAKLISTMTKAAFRKNILTRCAGIIALPVMRGLKKSLDPDEYNGASLLGLQGIVVKSHGGASELAFQHAIKKAMSIAEAGLIHKLTHQLSQYNQVVVN